MWDNYKHYPKYHRPYNPVYYSYIVADQIQPTFETFLSKSGRSFTRVVFHIPGMNDPISLLDFCWNANTRIIKIPKNKFQEAIINEVESYIANTPDAFLKKIPEVSLKPSPEQTAKNLNLDHLFDELGDNPEEAK